MYNTTSVTVRLCSPLPTRHEAHGATHNSSAKVFLFKVTGSEGDGRWICWEKEINEREEVKVSPGMKELIFHGRIRETFSLLPSDL